jgi:hypothetical protein
MEFLGHPDLPALKNLYPCLATITVTPPGHDNKSRRLSAGSGGEDENALKRVISGGRRKSSFGAGTGLGDERRKSGEYQPTGTWYWRVQAGVTDVSSSHTKVSFELMADLDSPRSPPAHSAAERTPHYASCAIVKRDAYPLDGTQRL